MVVFSSCSFLALYFSLKFQCYVTIGTYGFSSANWIFTCTTMVISIRANCSHFIYSSFLLFFVSSTIPAKLGKSTLVSSREWQQWHMHHKRNIHSFICSSTKLKDAVFFRLLTQLSVCVCIIRYTTRISAYFTALWLR